MRLFILSFIWLFSTSLCAQRKTETFSSEKLNEDRKITIGLPKSYKSDTNKKYPLLFLLDGDYLFDPFYGIIRYGSNWDELPEMIVVGISQNKNDQRKDDCQFDDTSDIPNNTESNFYDFIKKELLPYLNKEYRIASFKIIAGHGLTAGFLNFFLYENKPLFNAYISLSPDLSSNMKEKIPTKVNISKQPLFYYLATADEDVKKFQNEIKQLDANLKTIASPTFNYLFSEFKGTHYSLVPQAIPNALYYIFEAYQPITIAEYQNKIAVLKDNYTDYLAKKYSIQKAQGVEIPIRFNDFKAIETAIIKNEAYQEFEKLADLSKKNSPKTMLSDYYMAQFYENTGNTKKAMKTYLGALLKEEIGPLTKDMMYEKAENLKI